MQTLSIELRRFFEQAVTQYQSDLAGPGGTNAREYLRTRGIGPETAARFRLGVATSPRVGHEGLRGRLVIPYLTPAGPVNFSFRCLRQHDCKDVGCPKYLPIEGMERNLYNVLDLKVDSPFICVTEGELDALTLSMVGLPAVGIPGVKTWQKHFARCLEDFDRILVLGDGDKAGRGFGSFLAKEVRALPITLPVGEDVNSLYMKHGREALYALTQTKG